MRRLASRRPPLGVPSARRELSGLALPVVDLAQGEAAAARALYRAATGPGFLYLAGHGVRAATTRRAFAAMEHFFALPEQSKLAAHKSRTGNFRGYVGFFEQGDYGVDESDARAGTGAGALDEPAKMDFKEVFHLGTELSPGHQQYHPLLYSSNVWPQGQPELRAALEAYYAEVLAASDAVLELFALSLGLPRVYFVGKAQRTPMNSMNCVRYPPLSAFPASQQRKLSSSQLGIGSHTDFEAVTLLAQHGPKEACLEVLRDGKEWYGVPPVEGMLVVNIGDMMARWTGDLFRSTVHRAKNHPSQVRMSIAFFRAPDFDAELSAADISARVREYTPVRAGAHLLSRIQKANEPLGV
jgi:isopenicillin N synthase-like dioxygenase